MHKQFKENKELMISLNNEISSKQKQRSILEREISFIDKISKSQTTEIGITDHAFLRYVERCLGVDLNVLKSKIITPELEKMVKFMNGSGKITIGKIEYIVKDNIIVTIINHPRK